MRRVSVNPIARAAARGRLSKWMGDRSNQAGALAAGQTILADASTDPYGAISRGIGAFFGARAEDRKAAEAKAERDALLQEERARQARKDSMDEEEFGLRKKDFESRATQEAERRALAEQQRAALKAHWETLPPEDQSILGPFVSDPEKFFDVWDTREDNRRQQAQFDATLGETKRRNSVDERNDAVRIGLERERIKASQEAAASKPRYQLKKNGGFLDTFDPVTGEVISREPVAANPADIEKQVLKLMQSGLMTADQAAEQLNAARLAAGSASPQSAPPASPDEEAAVLAEVERLRAEGLSDEDIIAAAPEVKDIILRSRSRQQLAPRGGLPIPRGSLPRGRNSTGAF